MHIPVFSPHGGAGVGSGGAWPCDPAPGTRGRGGRGDVTAPEELVFIALAAWKHPGVAGRCSACVFGAEAWEKTPRKSPPNPPGSRRHQLPGPRVLGNGLAAASSAWIAGRGQNLQAGGDTPSSRFYLKPQVLIFALICLSFHFWHRAEHGIVWDGPGMLSSPLSHLHALE